MNELLIANLTLDTTRKNNITPLVVPRGDYGARVIRAEITDLGKPVIVESTAAVSIVATRSGDGESQAFSGSVNADGTVTVPVTQWMLDVPEEDVTCHIVVTGIGYQYSTTSFLIEPQAKATPTEIAPDDPRPDLVTEVLAGENTRRAAESERVSNENARIAAENARQSAEEQRVTDESTRITNEAQRVSAESSRDATFKGWAQDIASLPTFDGRIIANRKRIENLESGIPAESFIIDDSVAYTKDVPENIAPNAAVQKVGGMTRKCANLFDKATVSVALALGKDGAPYSSETMCYSAPIAVKEGQPYSIVNALWYNFYSNDGIPSSSNHVSQSSGSAVTIPSGAKFIRISAMVNSLDSVMLNLGTEPLPYEPYFEGLRSAKVTEVESVGVNIANCTVNQKVSGVTFGNIDGRCVLNGTAITVFSFDLVKVWREAGTYTLGASGLNINGVDRVYIKSVSGTIAYGNTTAKVEISEAGEYTISIVLNTGSAYSNKDIELFLYEGTTAQPYRPYSQHTLPIPDAVRNLDGYGWGVNENCYNYIDWEKKQFVKRVGVVDMGTLGWVFSTSGQTYFNSSSLTGLIKNSGKIICSNYVVASADDVYVGSTAIAVNGTRLWIHDTSYSDAATFKAAMSGAMLVYELAEPIITDISDLITVDNLIAVEVDGTLTFENEYGYAVPSTIIYQSR